MNLQDVKIGLKVRTAEKLGSTQGMIINPKNIAHRRPNAEGVVSNWVPGHGGDVWWIEHPGEPRKESNVPYVYLQPERGGKLHHPIPNYTTWTLCGLWRSPLLALARDEPAPAPEVCKKCATENDRRARVAESAPAPTVETPEGTRCTNLNPETWR